MMKRVFAVVALSVVLTSCGTTEGETDATNAETPPAAQESTDSDPSADSGQNSTGARDLSEGGTCTSGEEIVIGTDKSSPVIDGECGVVTVLASGVTGNVAHAQQVVLLGEGSTLLGTSWAEAVAEGANSTLNVDDLGAVTVVGKGSQVTNKSTDTMILTGDNITVNSDNLGSLISTGHDVKVVVSGEIGELEVLGNNGSFNWSAGADAPKSDEGSDNMFVR